MSEPKIGVWVCECGGNIGDVVETKEVIDALGDEDDLEGDIDLGAVRSAWHAAAEAHSASRVLPQPFVMCIGPFRW